MNLIFTVLISSLFFSLHGSEIAVVTIASGANYRNAVQQGINNKSLYCNKHGYDFICCDISLDASRPVAWSKILILLQTMENPEYKWIFWTDDDSLFMNYGIQIESLIDENYNIIIAKDPNGINSGQFLIKNSAWSRQFLYDVYAHTECINHFWWEQQAIILEYKQNPEVAAQIKFIPQRLLNSFAREVGLVGPNTTYQPGDFIIHFPSIRNLSMLSTLFEKYAPLCIDDPTSSFIEQ